MSGATPPPPPPPVSPDGKHYWDGSRWVPMPGPIRGRSSPTATLAIIGVILAVLIVAGLIWYFGFYDTAEGRCNRGDLGACVVVAGKQAAASAAAEDAARAALETAMNAGCTVVADPNHDMRLTYIGSDSASNCSSAKNQGWVDASRVPGSSIVCANSILVVEDTGGRVLGTDLCQQLHLTVRP